MSWPLIQVAVLAAMTQAVRAVGDRLGPRWGALVLGMPSTTAVLLVGGGFERGSAEASRAGGVGLLGLVAAVALPLAYARAVARGWGITLAPLAGVAGYVATAAALHAAPDLGAIGGLGVAVLGVTLGCRMARRMPTLVADPGPLGGSRSLAFRLAVPAAFVILIRAFRAAFGPEWAGIFATFPAMSLAVLVTLHIEGGPASAAGMARSMPRGNLGMIAFLAAFRASCHALGPFAAAAVGYAAVLVTMVGLVRSNRREQASERGLAAARPGLRVDGCRIIATIPRPSRRWRQFAPRVEAIAG